MENEITEDSVTCNELIAFLMPLTDLASINKSIMHDDLVTVLDARC